MPRLMLISFIIFTSSAAREAALMLRYFVSFHFHACHADYRIFHIAFAGAASLPPLLIIMNMMLCVQPPRDLMSLSRVTWLNGPRSIPSPGGLPSRQ